MACSVTLSSYKFGDCFSSRGGIKNLWIAVYDENAYVISSADTVSDLSGSTSAGTIWYKQELKRNTGSMTSTYSYDEANGSSYVQTDATIVYPKMAKKNRIQMNALALGDLMAIVEDANGVYYALGGEEPVKCTAGTGETGTERGDRNAYECTLSDYSSVYPRILDDTAISKLPTEAIDD